MELVIRNKGCMVAKITGPHASHALEQLRVNLTPVKKSEKSKCMAVYRLNDNLRMPIEAGGMGVNIFLWEHDTTVAVFL